MKVEIILQSYLKCIKVYIKMAHLTLLQHKFNDFTKGIVNYPANPNSFIALDSQLSVSAWFLGFFCAKAIDTT